MIRSIEIELLTDFQWRDKMIAVEVIKNMEGCDITVEFGLQKQVSLVAIGEYAQ